MTIKISYLSDLHVEFGDNKIFSKEEGGDVLLLAGDIVPASYILDFRNDSDARSIKKYLTNILKPQLLEKYKTVYMVMGNHEHYRWFYNETKKALQKSFKELGLNIIILDNEWVMLRDDLMLIGSTLWSDFEKGNPISMSTCQFGMNDFRIIGKNLVKDKNDVELITPQFIMNEHKNSLSYIKEILDRYSNMRTIIMTHHAPVYRSLNPKHIGNGMDGAYASELTDFICGYPQIQYWIHGHVHGKMNFKVGDYCTVLQNCRGYYPEDCFINFTGTESINV